LPRRGNELVVISWRDIPAQVNASAGNGRTKAAKHQVVLPRRFQKAIDDAAMVADKKTASEYVGEWRRTAIAISPPDGDIEGGIAAAAEREARRLDDAFPRARLARLVANGGHDPDARP
jgi:hypothetical protein